MGTSKATMAAFMLEFGIFLIAMQCSYIVTAPAKALGESNSDENDRNMGLEEISQEKQNPILVLYPLFPEEMNLYDSKIFSINQPSFSAQNSIQLGISILMNMTEEYLMIIVT